MDGLGADGRKGICKFKLEGKLALNNHWSNRRRGKKSPNRIITKTSPFNNTHNNQDFISDKIHPNHRGK